MKGLFYKNDDEGIPVCVGYRHCGEKVWDDWRECGMPAEQNIISTTGDKIESKFYCRKHSPLKV